MANFMANIPMFGQLKHMLKRVSNEHCHDWIDNPTKSDMKWGQQSHNLSDIHCFKKGN